MSISECSCFNLKLNVKFFLKALPALIEQGDGFSQVLKMQPVIHLQRIHQEVFSSRPGKTDAKPKSFAAQIETTPTDTASRKASNMVLKRKPAANCPQRKCYPLRPKRINLDTWAFVVGVENRHDQHVGYRLALRQTSFKTASNYWHSGIWCNTVCPHHFISVFFILTWSPSMDIKSANFYFLKCHQLLTALQLLWSLTGHVFCWVSLMYIFL